MKIHAFRDIGDFAVNSYAVETDSRRAILIDAPGSAEYLSSELSRLGLDLGMILLTHGHCDHTEALAGLLKKYPCPVYISPGDAEMLTDSRASLAEFFGRDFEPVSGAKPLSDGQKIGIDGVELGVVFTPGHSRGSVCYLLGGTVFSGDTLFRGTVGRTDLNGDFGELLRSVEKLSKIAVCGDVLPGHGEPTDLDSELCFNPYLEPLRR